MSKNTAASETGTRSILTARTVFLLLNFPSIQSWFGRGRG